MKKITKIILSTSLALMIALTTISINPVVVSAKSIEITNSFTDAKVTRSADSNTITISWNNNSNLGEINIFEYITPNKPMINLVKTVKVPGNSKEGSVTFADPNPGYRSYYSLISSKGTQ